MKLYMLETVVGLKDAKVALDEEMRVFHLQRDKAKNIDPLQRVNQLKKS
jgi:hypothetical protein